MSTYIISDIHGQGALFHAMLEKIRFSREDTLYIIGDVVDRGPDGIALLREIMASPNMVLLLGNHEHMMLQYLFPEATEIDIRRWDKNGNAPTLEAWGQLPDEERTALLAYLSTLPIQKRIQVGEKAYFLAHGFPGDSAYETVWGRPAADAANPIEDARLIIGHTPVMYMHTERENVPALVEEMNARGEHPKIYHGPGFIDVDCGCSFRDPIKTLGCLRLDDMAEFYMWNTVNASLL